MLFQRHAQQTRHGGMLLAGLFAASIALAACTLDPAATSPEGGIDAQSTGDSKKSSESVRPRGCSRVWNDVAADSVLYCPEVRPPRPVSGEPG